MQSMLKPNKERIPREMPFPLQRNVNKRSARIIFGLISLVGIGGGYLLGSPYIGNRNLPNSGSKMGTTLVYVVPTPKEGLLKEIEESMERK